MITELPIQGLPTGKRPPFVVVASDDTPDFLKKSADFVCDGVNDHVEIQQAIDKITQSGTIVLLGGTFNLSGNITINKNNVSIVGVFRPTINAQADSIIYIGDPSNNIKVENIEISNIITTRSNPTIGFSIRSIGLSLTDVNTNITISNSDLSDLTELYMEYTSDFSIIGNNLPKYVHILNVSNGVLENNYFNDSYVYSFASSSDIRVSNNVFYSESGNTVQMNDVERLIISNNTFYKYKLGGLSDKGCVVSNNVFYNSYIYENGGYKIVISSNKFHGDPSYPYVIEIDHSNAVISGNLITDISSSITYTIYSSYSNVSIFGNSISGTPGNGAIYVVHRNSISGNTIYNFTNGIVVDGPYSSIHGNVIDTCSANGILINGSYNTIVGNNITSCATGINLSSTSSYNYVGKNIITNYSTAGINDSGSNNIIGVKDTTNNVDNYY